ncbi:protein of unknown function [Agreia sp. COWG]|nr:protein of unknown function [Agreia sp. COWG]
MALLTSLGRTLGRLFDFMTVVPPVQPAPRPRYRRKGNLS